MKITAKVAREKMNANIEKKNAERRRQEAEKTVNDIIVPLIEKAVENCGYQVYVKKALLENCCISDCYGILTENGFKYTNFVNEFLIEW